MSEAPVRDQAGRVEVVDDGCGVLLQPRGERGASLLPTHVRDHTSDTLRTGSWMGPPRGRKGSKGRN